MTTATRDQRTKLMVHYPAGNAADPRELQAFLDAVIASVGPSVIIGGTTASSTLTLKSTTGVGTTDAIIFLVGNNGSIEAARFVTGGQLIKGHTASIATSASFTNPAIQTHGTALNTSSNSITKWTNDANGATLLLAKSRGTSIGSRGVVSSGDDVGNIGFYGDDGTNFIRLAIITGNVDGTPGTNDMPGRLMFFTTADGAADVTERARIDNKGNVVINTAAIATNATDGFLYLPSCAGTPTGTPTTYSGRVPTVVNTSQNGLHFFSGSVWRGMAFIDSGTITNAATKDFTVPSGYDVLEFELVNWAPATDAVELWLRFSQSGSFLSGLSDYEWGYERSVGNNQDSADSEITIADNQGNAAGELLTLTVKIYRPSAASFRKTATWTGGYITATPNRVANTGRGSLAANTDAIDGVRFLYSSGNISSGYYTFRAYKYG